MVCFYFFQRKPKVTGEQGSNTASERWQKSGKESEIWKRRRYMEKY